MIELFIVGGLAALMSHAKNQTFEGKLERLQEDFKSGKLSPQDAQNRYQAIAQNEMSKMPASGIPLPKEVKQALENGLDYQKLAGKVDPNTYNFLEQAYWYGDYDRPERR